MEQDLQQRRVIVVCEVSLSKFWRSPISIYHELNQVDSDQLLVEVENDGERVAPVFNHMSLQPDLVLWKKGELFYQIHMCPSSTIRSIYYSAFPSVVILHAL